MSDKINVSQKNDFFPSIYVPIPPIFTSISQSDLIQFTQFFDHPPWSYSLPIFLSLISTFNPVEKNLPSSLYVCVCIYTYLASDHFSHFSSHAFLLTNIIPLQDDINLSALLGYTLVFLQSLHIETSVFLLKSNKYFHFRIKFKIQKLIAEPTLYFLTQVTHSILTPDIFFQFLGKVKHLTQSIGDVKLLLLPFGMYFPQIVWHIPLQRYLSEILYLIRNKK